MTTKVLVNGACGKMGRETCRAIISDPELELYIACDADPAYAARYAELPAFARNVLLHDLPRRQVEFTYDGL